MPVSVQHKALEAPKTSLSEGVRVTVCCELLPKRPPCQQPSSPDMCASDRQAARLSGEGNAAKKQIYPMEQLVTVTACSQLWLGKETFWRSSLGETAFVNTGLIRVR